MSFHKRYITKESILSNIHDLDRLFSADALVSDMWSTRFMDDLDINEKYIRESINDKWRFSSSLDYKKDPQFKDLHSMAECLISLKTNPSWLDVILVSEKLGLEATNSGKFLDSVNNSIQRIIDYYDKPNRNDKIEEILKDDTQRTNNFQ